MTAAGRRPFPLVPRRRYVGVRFGQHRSPRRGQGDEVAGTRPYRSGDRPTWIDWRASARLSAARGDDEFVVREFFGDTAPRVALVVDRSPRMMISDPSFPWLDKRAASDHAVSAIARATAAEAGDLGLVEQRGGHPTWLPPGPPALALRRPRLDDPVRPSATGTLARCLDVLVRHASSFPPGTFVFVVSDFVDAAPARSWVRLRALHWDVVPVIVQDPMWEQSFPAVGGVLLPFLDPATGQVTEVVLRPSEARERATANERRLADMMGGFTRLGFDPVLLGSAEQTEIDAAFTHWAERRRRLRRRSA